MKILRRSLFARVVFAFIILTLINNALLTFLAYQQAHSQLSRSLFVSLSTAGAMREEALTQWYTTQRERVHYLAQMDTVQNQAVLLATASRDSESYRTAQTTLAAFLENTLIYEQGFKDVLFLDSTQGEVLVATNPLWVGEKYAGERYYVEGRQGFFMQSLYRASVTQQPEMTLAIPVLAPSNTLLGVLVVHLDLDVFVPVVIGSVEIFGDAANTEIYLLTPDYIALGNLDVVAAAEWGWQSKAITATLLEKQNGYGNYVNYAGKPVIGVYRWLDELGLALIIEVDQKDFLALTRGAVGLNFSVGLLVTLLFSVAIYAVARSIVKPIQTMTKATTVIAAGDLIQQVPIHTEDELGVLGVAFNRMVEQLRRAHDELETRVAERTVALEERSNQLHSSALVVRRVLEIRDLTQLLETTVALIVERFSVCYYAAIFLLDDSKTIALLRAASSEIGQQMLARGYQVRLGEGDIVALAAADGEPHIVLDIGTVAQSISYSEFPATRSGMALPLKIGHEIIGVLEVQSEQPEAFGDDELAVLSIVADQVTVAIQNARLLAQMQERIQEISFLLRTQSQEAWQRFTAQRPDWGYVYDGMEVVPVAAAPYTAADVQVSLPLQVRSGEQLGRLDVRLGGRRITPSELALAQAIAQQASQALDSARLFQQTQLALRRSEALYQAGQLLINFENIGEVLQSVAHAIAEALFADRVLLITVNLEERKVEHFARGGSGAAQISEASFEELEQGLSGWVLREQKPTLSPQNVPDPRESPEVQRRRRETECGDIIVAPFLYAGRVLGTITVMQRTDQPGFTDADVDLVMAMANQAAAAIQNARLFQETQALLDETEILYQSSRNIGAAHAPEDILQAFVDYAAAERVGRCILGVFDPERPPDDPVFQLLATWDRGDARAAPVSGQQWAVHQLPVLKRMIEEPLVLSNLAETPKLDEISRLTLWGRLGIQALAVIPLISAGKPLGWVLLAVLDGPYEFSERERRLFRTLGDSAAFVLENLRLLETTRRRADYELRKTVITSRVRASVDIDAILRASVLELGKILHAEDALIVLASPEAERPEAPRSER